MFVCLCGEHNWRSDPAGKIISLTLTFYYFLPRTAMHKGKMKTFYPEDSNYFNIIAVKNILGLYLHFPADVISDHYNSYMKSGSDRHISVTQTS